MYIETKNNFFKLNRFIFMVKTQEMCKMKCEPRILMAVDREIIQTAMYF